MHHEMCYAHEIKFAWHSYALLRISCSERTFHGASHFICRKANFIAHLRCAKLQFAIQKAAYAAFVKLKLVVFYYVFCQFYQLLTDPHRLNDLEICAKRNKHAEKLLYIVEFANVSVAGLLGDDEIF